MYCGACGTQNDDKSEFCNECGANLSSFAKEQPAKGPYQAEQAPPQQAPTQQKQ